MVFSIYLLSHSLYVVNVTGSHPIIPETSLERHQVSYLVSEVLTIKDTLRIQNEGGMVSYLRIPEWIKM